MAWAVPGSHRLPKKPDEEIYSPGRGERQAISDSTSAQVGLVGQRWVNDEGLGFVVGGDFKADTIRGDQDVAAVERLMICATRRVDV